MSTRTGPLERAKQWLADKLGPAYATVLDIAERAVAAFAVTFATTFLAADGLDIHHVLDLSVWQRAVVAGVAAGLSLVKSTVLQWLIGDPALGALVSPTLRARRDLPKPRARHRLPLRKPRRAA